MNNSNKNMIIRQADLTDLDSIVTLELQCFPDAEAASRKAFEERLSTYKNSFWLLEKSNELTGFINGMYTQETDLLDTMYETTAYYDENGPWLMIFGVNTAPQYRKQGYAAAIMEKVIADAEIKGAKGIVLTCKDYLLEYYSKFGFVNERISKSIHGGVAWNQMRLTF